MAWAIDVTGGGYLEFNEPMAFHTAQVVFRLEVDYIIANGSTSPFYIVKRNGSSYSRIEHSPTAIVVAFGNYRPAYPVTAWYNDGVTVTNLVITRDSNFDVVVTINDTIVATGTNTNTQNNYVVHTIGENGSPSNVTHLGMRLWDNLDGTGVPLYNYDPTASDHSGSTDQPTLIDTVGGNDATGVNFPSFDASVWVNLGGGDVVSIDATLGLIDYSSNNAVVELSGSIDITPTLGLIELISNNAQIQLSGVVDVAPTLGLITYSSNNSVVSLFGEIEVSPTLGLISYQNQNSTVQLSGEVLVPVTLGLIDYQSIDSNISLASDIEIAATLGLIDYTSIDAQITTSGLIDVVTTLGVITYNNYNVSVKVGGGQIIGNVTVGFKGNKYTSAFKDDQYSASYKSDTITVNFK